MNKFIRRRFKIKSLAVAMCVSILFFSLTFLYWSRTENNQNDELKSTIKSESIKVNELILNQFRTFDLVARSVKGFIEGSEDVTSDEFKSFVAAIDVANVAPGLQGVGVAWIFQNIGSVEDSSRISTKNNYDNLSNDFYIDFAPLVYMEPKEFNGKKIGQNIFSDKNNKEAAELSNFTNTVIGTKKNIEKDKSLDKDGYKYNLFLPIYSESENSNNNKRLLGWVVLSIDIEEVLKPITSTIISELQLRFQDRIEQEINFFTDKYYSNLDNSNNLNFREKQFSYVQEINYAGQHWMLTIDPSPELISRYKNNTHTLIAIVGLLLSASIGVIVYLMMAARYRAEKLAFDMTKEMRKVADDMSDTLSAVPDLLFEMNLDGRYVKFNKSNNLSSKLRIDDYIGKTIWEVLPLKSAISFKNAIDQANVDGKSFGTTIEIPLGSGVKTFELSVSKKSQSKPGIESFIVISRDITDRAEAQEKIHRLAYYDELTGLPNRSLFLRKATDTLMEISSYKQAAVLMIDVDNFKNINDQWGHGVGDSVLRVVGERIQSAIGPTKLVARFGGDEFIALISDLGDSNYLASQAMTLICKKICNELSSSITIDDREFYASSSIGVALTGCGSFDLDDLISFADFAMYQAKSNGKNTFSFYDSRLKNEMYERALLEHAMKSAINSGQFELHYQPQINKLGKLTGAEALCRWKHPSKGYISPQVFIELAESNGFIFELGEWVIKKACEQLAYWNEIPCMSNLNVAVNVSAKQFHHPEFESNLLYCIALSGVEPERLKLEITESALVKDVESVILKMNNLKKLGINFSIDDFGTGYSSLSYLKRLPLDQLKIDQSFVRDLLEDSSDAVIVQTIIALGENLGLDVIAEGVETAEQHQFLMQHGCFNYQGYFFSRPLNAADFESYVDSRLN